MPNADSKVTVHPPPGRPSWGGEGNLPLIYLGWGRRDFKRHPLPVHYDRGTNYFVLVSGEIVLTAGNDQQTIQGPAAIFIDSDCRFGITQARRENVNILVWVWKARPDLPELRLAQGGHLTLDLKASSIQGLKELHMRCRKEIAMSDISLPFTLNALRQLLEVEILRATRASAVTGDLRWELAHSWMMNNLSIHTPVPALCDYLGMSPSALHRFFRSQVGQAPGAFFRKLKWQEARRLVDVEGWQVKAAAYHLGYRHPNDLSRALKETNQKS
ncbi:MAG: helix-turn-helix domain-containing protein [Verrucomicrobiota bacterium]